MTHPSKVVYSFFAHTEIDLSELAEVVNMEYNLGISALDITGLEMYYLTLNVYVKDHEDPYEVSNFACQPSLNVKAPDKVRVFDSNGSEIDDKDVRFHFGEDN